MPLSMLKLHVNSVLWHPGKHADSQITNKQTRACTEVRANPRLFTANGVFSYKKHMKQQSSILETSKG